MDMEQPSLCHAHAQVGNQSLDKPDAPQVQTFVAGAYVFALVWVDSLVPAPPNRPIQPLLNNSGAPPLSIRNCCFRI